MTATGAQPKLCSSVTIRRLQTLLVLLLFFGSTASPREQWVEADAGVLRVVWSSTTHVHLAHQRQLEPIKQVAAYEEDSKEDSTEDSDEGASLLANDGSVLTPSSLKLARLWRTTRTARPMLSSSHSSRGPPSIA